jgi:hypothetical protein
MPDPKIELEMFGQMRKCSVEFQRGTATADYAANDVVAGSAAGVFEIPNAGRWPGSSQYLVGLRAVIDTPSITPRFRVHFFNSSAATVAADNAKWAETYAQTSLRTGYADPL